MLSDNQLSYALARMPVLLGFNKARTIEVSTLTPGFVFQFMPAITPFFEDSGLPPVWLLLKKVGTNYTEARLFTPSFGRDPCRLSSMEHSGTQAFYANEICSTAETVYSLSYLMRALNIGSGQSELQKFTQIVKQSYLFEYYPEQLSVKQKRFQKIVDALFRWKSSTYNKYHLEASREIAVTDIDVEEGKNKDQFLDCLITVHDKESTSDSFEFSFLKSCALCPSKLLEGDIVNLVNLRSKWSYFDHSRTSKASHQVYAFHRHVDSTRTFLPLLSQIMAMIDAYFQITAQVNQKFKNTNLTIYTKMFCDLVKGYVLRFNFFEGNVPITCYEVNLDKHIRTADYYMSLTHSDKDHFMALFFFEASFVYNSQSSL